MRRIGTSLLVLVAAVSLVACEQSIEDVKEEAEFAKVCKDGGGRVDYDGFNQMFCNFYEKRS